MSSVGDDDWWGAGTIPAPASIVWCNFPEDIAPRQPGPKPRPGLVFKVRYASEPPDDRFLVLIAYGTSKLKLNRRPNDFTVANATTLDILRLPQATRFDLDRILWLPWARPFFSPRDRRDLFSTPTLSVLPESAQQSLRWTMGRREQLGLNSAYHATAPLQPPRQT